MSTPEKHYTCREIGLLWHLDAETVRPLFEHVKGVIKITHKATRTKRGYISLRIPEAVMTRVYATLTKAA